LYSDEINNGMAIQAKIETGKNRQGIVFEDAGYIKEK
jgi:hypothetical protein